VFYFSHIIVIGIGMSSPFTNAVTSNLYMNAHDSVLNEFDVAIKSELLLETATKKQLTDSLGGDATSRTSKKSGFIGEELQPLLEILGESPENEQNRSGDSVALSANDQGEQPLSEDDQRAMNEILATLNGQQQKEQTSGTFDPERQLLRNLEAGVQEHVKQVQEREQSTQPSTETLVSEADIAPMIEAITTPMPQICINLPGGGELRIAINSDGNPHIMYTGLDGSLRPLAKGRTLRLNKWVNGVTFTKDGLITFAP
jgi:hypothetical protein